MVHNQIPNLVYAKNVFTNETLLYEGDNCIKDFMTYMMNVNKGNVILLAHNGKGYDTRLIYEDIIQRKSDINISAIMAGSHFNEIKIGRQLYLRDTMLHMVGSLKNIAKDNGCTLDKGYFPHLFNSLENYNYVGPIPEKRFFDMSANAKSQTDFDEFNKWYSEQSGEWNFKTELKKYCINDVEVLAEIVLKYHTIKFEQFKISPWKSMTNASYHHKVAKIMITRNLELDPTSENYLNDVERLARTSHWAVLKSPEYVMARKALRGGRTGIGKIHHIVSEQDAARGVKIEYQDVCSLYPFQQIDKMYPVGLPTIHVFDDEFRPCFVHTNNHDSFCDCPRIKRYNDQNFNNSLFAIKSEPEQWTVSDILNDPTFHGFVCASLTPPQMLFPVLVHYDEKLEKCVASCEPLVKGFFTTPEFIVALKNGYKLDRLHRFDRYHMAEPIWGDIVKTLYISKMVNSRDAPTGNEKDELINDYEAKFDMGDELLKTFNPNIWGNNPAKKTAAKIGVNSGWGKHAQRPVMVQDEIVTYSDPTQYTRAISLFANISKNLTSLKSSLSLGHNRFLYKYIEDGYKKKVDHSNTYLPAACFVPAYGRLQLWEQLHKLGDRVLMYDTDSIVYVRDPDLYNIPTGSLLGDWETEKESKIGIKEFIGLGPKSYAFNLANGQEVIKLKGISQKRGTSKIVCFENLRKMVARSFETGIEQVLQIPQTKFQYTMTKGIQTHSFLKELSFSIHNQKGVVGEDKVIYPAGYLFE